MKTLKITDAWSEWSNGRLKPTRNQLALLKAWQAILSMDPMGWDVTSLAYDVFSEAYALAGTGPQMPKVVCLCGSTRFMQAFQEANLKLTFDGYVVLSVGCNTKSDTELMAAGELTQALKRKLDLLHKRKIDMADEILVLNVGGYIGQSTQSEIEYAEQEGKPIKYLEPLK
jgi:hypothetical protein